MGDANTALTAAHARHLLRRTGFGAPTAAVNKLIGDSRGSAVNRLLAFAPTKFKPGGGDIDKKLLSWIKYMIEQPFQLQEKLVLFWHDHFASSYIKVQNPKLLANQNKLFRTYCKGNFKALVKEVNRDAAMIEYLDTARNRRDVPNENYARELMELFTLGVKDASGNPNYDQADIVQIARAFTGWSYFYRSGKTTFNDYDHDYAADYPERGPKVIFTTRGGFGAAGRSFAANGEGPTEIDSVVDILFDHRDSTGQKTVARYVTGKLLTYFAQPGPKRPVQASLLPVIDAIVAASGFDVNWDIRELLRALFVHDAFYDTAATAPFDASTKKSVKWPIDFVVSTMRLLKMKPKGKYGVITGGNYRSLHDHLENMGQHLFEPPSVFGWDWEAAWLSSSTLLARYGFARDLVAARDGAYRFRPEDLVDLTLTDPAVIVDAVTDVFGVTDQLTAGEKTALVSYLTDDGQVAAVDLQDYDVRNVKLHGLFALVMQAAAYQMH